MGAFQNMRASLSLRSLLRYSPQLRSIIAVPALTLLQLAWILLAFGSKLLYEASDLIVLRLVENSAEHHPKHQPNLVNFLELG